MWVTNIRDISVKFNCDIKTNQIFYIVKCIVSYPKKNFIQRFKLDLNLHVFGKR